MMEKGTAPSRRTIAFSQKKSHPLNLVVLLWPPKPANVWTIKNKQQTKDASMEFTSIKLSKSWLSADIVHLSEDAWHLL
jgi:hypothetical protein